MTENTHKTFTLYNRLAAISAQPSCDRIIASDGINCNIYIVNENRCCNESICAVRPYRRLRTTACNDGYTALSCCNNNNLYFLNESFCENGYITLDASSNCNCSENRCRTSGTLTDAIQVCIGNNAFILGAFDNGAYLFDSNGKRMTQLCSTDNGESLTDFITFGDEKYAMSTLCGNKRTVTVSDSGTVQSAILGKGFSLRMLLAENGIVYGLFGRNYIYNQIIPIYSDGRLILPELSRS